MDNVIFSCNLASGQINYVYTVGPAWHVAALGDFNGDNRDDILWRNDSGQINMMRMNGPSVVAIEFLTSATPSWHVTGVGDYNGDGRDDLLCRNDDGTIKLMCLNGVQILTDQVVAPSPPEWNMAGHHYELV